MIIDLDQISNDLLKIQQQLKKDIKPLSQTAHPTISIQDAIKNEMNTDGTNLLPDDIRYIIKAYKILRKLGCCKNQYEYSEDFLQKTPYYYGMIKCSQRAPSVDSISNLLKKISSLNDGIKYDHYLNNLYQEGQQIITKRLCKYF